MTSDWLGLVERLGLPVALLGVGVAVVWALSRRLLSSLIESYRERIAGLCADRDHVRARSEAAEDRMSVLARELIDECRGEARRDVGVADSGAAQRGPRGADDRARPRAREGADGC